LICPQAEGLVAELIVSPSVTDALCLGADASVTVNLTCVVPVALCAGVPVIAPVDALIDRPLGSSLALNAYGFVPPLAARLAEYASPTVPAGIELVEIASSLAATTMLIFLLALCGVADESATVK